MRTTANAHGSKMRLTQREKPWTVRARHLANRGGMTEMIRTWWPVAITVIAAIAWLIRLEARGISNGTDDVLCIIPNNSTGTLDIPKRADFDLYVEAYA